VVQVQQLKKGSKLATSWNFPSQLHVFYTFQKKIAEVCGDGITIDGEESIPDFPDEGGTTSDDGWSNDVLTLVTSCKAVRQTYELWPSPR